MLKPPPALAWAQTRYAGKQSLSTTWLPEVDGYVLRDPQRQITTYNCRGDAYLRMQHFVDADNQWTAAEWDNAQADQAALDAHWGLGQVSDFWQNFLQLDLVQPPLYNFVHFDPDPYDQQGYNNAAWDGEQWVYGDGHAQAPLTALDIVAHEYTHAVLARTAQLIGYGPPGEVGEALADIWAACATQFIQQGHLNAEPDTEWGANPIWYIGESCQRGGYRSLSHPEWYGQPSAYMGRFYNPDNPDVHHNSTVLSHWFYQCCIQGMGMAQAAALLLDIQCHYLTPQSNLLDVCYNSLGWVYLQFGIASQEWKSVVHAWQSVGLWDAHGARYVTQFLEAPTALYCTPNPVADTLLVYGHGASFWPTLSIWDQQGRQLYTYKLENLHGNFEQKIDVSGLQNGVYFIELQGENQRQTLAFVKR